MSNPSVRQAAAAAVADFALAERAGPQQEIERALLAGVHSGDIELVDRHATSQGSTDEHSRIDATSAQRWLDETPAGVALGQRYPALGAALGIAF